MNETIKRLKDAKKVKLLLERTKPNGLCLEWQGPRNKKGYGLTSYGSDKRMTANRAMMVAVHGAATLVGKVAAHTCDNPPCINPKHLFVCTQSENMQDCLKKGRFIMPPKTRKQLRSARRCLALGRLAKGSDHPNSFLKESDVKEIKYGLRELSQRKIAKLYGIDQTYVSQIRRGIAWKHI